MSQNAYRGIIIIATATDGVFVSDYIEDVDTWHDIIQHNDNIKNIFTV